MAKGKITEDKIIDEGVYQIGQKFAKSLKSGDDAIIVINNSLKKYADNLEIIKQKSIAWNKLEKEFTLSTSRKSFISSKKKEIELTEQSNIAIKEQKRLGKNLITIIERKNLAVESANKALIKERLELQRLNREEKQNAILTSKTSSELDKANVKRARAIKSIQDLTIKKELGVKLSNAEQRELRQSSREYLKYDKAIKVAKNSTGQFQENVGNYPKFMGGAITSFKTLIPLIGAGLGLREAWNFTKESLQLARDAKGVEFAFKNIGIESQVAFDRIKISTRGLISDLDIKKSLVVFDNFNLSLKQTDTLMEFLAVTSAQTGVSIDKLKDSLTEGISKQSFQRIDNLGISAKELNAQIEKTPDFLEAVANVAETKIKKAGNILDETANSQQKFNAQLESFQISAGSGFIKKMTDDVYDLGSALLSTFSDANESSDGFFSFFSKLYQSTNPGGALALKTEIAIKREIEKRKELLIEIDESEEKQGLSAKQRFINQKTYSEIRKLNSKELIQLLKSYQSQEDNKKQVRDIAFLREEISKLQGQQDGLTSSDKERSKEIKNKIKLHQDEINSILGVQKASKKSDKTQEEKFNLQKYRLEQQIKFREEVIENENKTTSEKLTAIQERDALEIKLNDLQQERLLIGVQKGSDEEKLILEKSQDDLIAIYQRTNDAIDKLKQDNLDNAPELVSESTDGDNDLDILKQGIKDYANTLGLDGEKALQEFVDLHGLKFEAVAEYYDSLDEKAEDSAKKRKELEEDLKDAVVDFSNALFDRKISGIEDEINANQEKYDNLIQLAEGDEEQQDALRRKQEKERLELEKKKKAEQRKQAIFNKAITIANIGFKTSEAIIGALAQVPKFDFGISASALATAYGAIGALQIATVIAQPLPKYAKGTDDHIGGFALVGEERPEVISEPNKAPYIISKPSVLDLPKHTVVTPSVEKYQQLMYASQLASLNINKDKVDSYNGAKNEFDNSYIKTLIDETKKNTDAVKKSKSNIRIQQQKVDIPFAIFKSNNLNW